MGEEETIRDKFALLETELDERARRMWTATEALSLGYGGVSVVHRATGVAISTVRRGINELMEPGRPAVGRVRRLGGVRKTATTTDPTLVSDVKVPVDSSTRGDPESPLRWTIKSVRRLSAELGAQGHEASHVLVARLLRDSGFSLEANRNVREAGAHPDRNLQFEHINRQVKARLRRREPVTSVDTKKKELDGSFKNAGREWHRKGKPAEVNSTISLSPNSARPFLTASTTSPGTRAGSVSEWTTILLSSSSRLSGAGGASSEPRGTHDLGGVTVHRGERQGFE
ncbi:MAG: ISAzo13 family transposase [Bryobacteraceae bacterium]